MKNIKIENNNLLLELSPNIGGSIFSFEDKITKKNIFRKFNKKIINKYSSIYTSYFSTIP